jgi:L-lactate dehydrogenase complex protein LldG
MRELLSDAVKRGTFPGATPDLGTFDMPPAPSVDYVSRFTSELAALGGIVHAPAAEDAATIASLIADAVPPGCAKRALLWDDAWLPVQGIGQALEAMGFEIDRQRPGDLAVAERRTELAAASVGVTGAHAALAETGSLVLVSGDGRGRLASLLPPVHVAIVRRASLAWSLPELLATRPDLAVAGSNLVCITGPSRTADIEHTLSRGVHGPGEVRAILIA